MRLKRIFIGLLLLLVIALGLAGAGYALLRTPPAFYRPYAWTPEQRSIINQRAVDKIALTHNLAARAQADERAAEHTVRTGAAPPDREAIQPVTVTFTEEELNAFLLHNGDFASYKRKLDSHVSDPGVYIQDGRLIFAGRVRQLDTVVSVHFAPRLDADGRLELRLDKILGGSLPVPQAVVEPYLAEIRDELRVRLSVWQRSARMDSTGAANSSAASAAMGKLACSVLARQSAAPVLFVPVGSGKSVPLRITHLSLANPTLAITFSPTTPPERQAILDEATRPVLLEENPR